MKQATHGQKIIMTKLLHAAGSALSSAKWNWWCFTKKIWQKKCLSGEGGGGRWRHSIQTGFFCSLLLLLFLPMSVEVARILIFLLPVEKRGKKWHCRQNLICASFFYYFKQSKHTDEIIFLFLPAAEPLGHRMQWGCCCSFFSSLNRICSCCCSSSSLNRICSCFFYNREIRVDKKRREKFWWRADTHTQLRNNALIGGKEREIVFKLFLEKKKGPIFEIFF